MKTLAISLAALGLLAPQAGLAAEAPGAVRASGPLRVHPRNPRYFTDDGGRAIYLTGSHTWSNLQDQGPGISRCQYCDDGSVLEPLVRVFSHCRWRRAASKRAVDT